jgi:hypothetical protein
MSFRSALETRIDSVLWQTLGDQVRSQIQAPPGTALFQDCDSADAFRTNASRAAESILRQVGFFFRFVMRRITKICNETPSVHDATAHAIRDADLVWTVRTFVSRSEVAFHLLFHAAHITSGMSPDEGWEIVQSLVSQLEEARRVYLNTSRGTQESISRRPLPPKFASLLRTQTNAELVLLFECLPIWAFVQSHGDKADDAVCSMLRIVADTPKFVSTSFYDLLAAGGKATAEGILWVGATPFIIVGLVLGSLVLCVTAPGSIYTPAEMST